MSNFPTRTSVIRALLQVILLLTATNAIADRYIFTYTYTGTFNGAPRPNPGSVLTGEIEGTPDPADLTGDTVIIDSFIWVTLRGIPYASITSDEINTNPPGGVPSMTFSGSGFNMNFRSCPNGFVQPPEDPSDCSFGNDGGFAVFFNLNRPDGASFSGVSGLGNTGRATDVPFFPENWSLVLNADNDGIEGTVDGTYVSSFVDQGDVFSNDFTDQHLGGATFGTVANRADQNVEVSDHLVDGVVLSANGGSGTAQIQMCNNPVADVFLTTGDRLIATCGSMNAVVLAGDARIAVGTVTITIPKGASVTIVEDPFSSELTVSNVGEVGGIEVDDGDSTTVLEPDGEVVAMLPGDTDNDGVPDADDFCPDTEIPEATSSALGNNRWRLQNGVWVFTQAEPQAGANLSFTTEDTRGCSCVQIVNLAGLGSGHLKHGCSTGAMLNWVNNP